MSPIAISDVTITDRFWSARQSTLISATLPHEWQMILDTNRLKNFHEAARAKAGATDATFEGRYFNDSDVYKWLEACALALQACPNHPGWPELQAAMDTAIAAIEAAQEESGYINTYFQIRLPEKKWVNLNSMHEMYCGGHLIEAGIAHFQATGSRKLLDVAIRFADHVLSIFGPGKRLGFCGHQEIELALLALVDVTKDSRYRELAKWMIEQRGQRPSIFAAEIADFEVMRLNEGMARLSVDERKSYVGDYLQDHAPIRDHDRVVGHAVRAMYFYIAATQVAEELDAGAESKGGRTVAAAILKCWDNLTQKRMYITGGIGPSGHNEGFTEDYDLPNLSAYAETCAAVGLALWGQRLTQYTGNATYFEPVERALYNGMLSGISLEGTHFFYDNPLESRRNHQRVPWFSCACCPPNIARAIAQISRFAIQTSDDGIWINLPIGLEAKTSFGTLTIQSGYPWDGTATVTVRVARPTTFTLRLRIPEWCDDFSLETGDAPEEAEYEDGYVHLTREWHDGDQAILTFEMEPKWIQSHPLVVENAGRLALTRGPLVYALEEHDMEGLPQHFLVSDESEVVESQGDKRVLDGIPTLTVSGLVETEPEQGVPGLYGPVETADVRDAKARMIPYFAWANRGPSMMLVWLRRF